ncbi:unnamed protein product [Staurois parvus]|uniref:Uncharacterized protein n=1 Tax=Staurois parvus TaxID=386267 RepID=A0ABN9CY57_9NEOB|nr:unnamed protein product [Staurois parvus]
MRLFCVQGARSPPSSRAAAPKVRTLQLAQEWAKKRPGGPFNPARGAWQTLASRM